MRVDVRVLTQARIIPVLRYSDVETTVYAAACAVQAGYTALELTATTPDVLQAFHRLRDCYGSSVALGVGTITDSRSAESVLSAGADFIVSPGCVPEVAMLAREAGALSLLGAFTPTELLAAMQAGADAVKLFPAETGGPSHLAALKAVFPDVPICPTGGITVDNIKAYLQAGAAYLGIGSSLFDKKAFAERDTEVVVASAKRVLEVAHA